MEAITVASQICKSYFGGLKWGVCPIHTFLNQPLPKVRNYKTNKGRDK